MTLTFKRPQLGIIVVRLKLVTNRSLHVLGVILDIIQDVTVSQLDFFSLIL